MRRPSPTRLLTPLLLLGAGFGMLVAISIATGMLVRQSRVDSDRIAHTIQTERQIAELLLQLRRAESAERGVVITGLPEYRDDYRAGAAAIPVMLAALRQLVGDNPDEMAKLERVEPLIERRLRDFETVVRLAGQHDPGAAEIVRNGQNRVVMETVRQILGEMSTEEDRLLTARNTDSNRTNTRLFAVAGAGIVMLVALAVVSLLLIRNALRHREAARQAIEDANANLEKTVKERTAELSAANEEIQRFAHIVSHDLRSPLVNIMGFTTEIETLRRQVFEELARLRAGTHGDRSDRDAELARDFDEAIEFIKSSITKMDRLINAVLRLSHEGRREFRPEPIDMTALIEAVGETVAHQAVDAGAEITVGPLPAIISDRLALEQIFSNLIDNALKYLRDGVPGRIEVTGRETATHNVYDVRDNGRGIDPEDHQRIFELFRRAGPQDRPGEGIGLAHVRALVRRLGGTMTLQSQPGEGSVFTVVLPQRWSVQPERSAA